MKNFLLASGIIVAMILSGCKQVEQQAQLLQKEGEKAVSGLSQQAEKLKTQALETKAAIDKKSQEIVNAVDAVNKATH